ncbi:hypothetical protein [Streptomyces sp. NPDC002644]
MDLIRTHATRLYALASAVLAVGVYYFPGLPDELFLGVVAAVLGVGEAVQRTEDAKTLDALMKAPVGGCDACPLGE